MIEKKCRIRTIFTFVLFTHPIQVYLLYQLRNLTSNDMQMIIKKLTSFVTGLLVLIFFTTVSVSSCTQKSSDSSQSDEVEETTEGEDEHPTNASDTTSSQGEEHPSGDESDEEHPS